MVNVSPSLVSPSPEGIITRLKWYNIDESRLFMKWQCCCGFMVPAGLLWVFPELSLVRCERPSTIHMNQEKNICEFESRPQCRPAHEL
jgi:hypothetical protein